MARCHAERNAEIIRRRQAGQMPAEIAREMKIARNVAIGVCHRAGLTSPKPQPAKGPGRIPHSTSGAGLKGALGLAQVNDTGRADRLLRKFSWQEEA